MFRPRVIPTLLLKDNGLVKSEKFKNHRYIGDPINAVNLFNDLKVDELCFLDITATKENRSVELDLLIRIADKANMPFSVGGGIRTLDSIRDILKTGAEKVVLSAYAVQNPDFVRQAADEFGSSTIAVCLDVKKNFWGQYKVHTHNGTKSTNLDPVLFAKKMEDYGAGEVIINSIDRDGTMNGYEIPLLRAVSEAVTIPVVALGGAGSMVNFKEAVEQGAVSAVAAGSFFIYKGARRAVLINYSGSDSFDQLFGNH
jgi:imidazole glycerol-phosphate synthase subunit HisF